MCKNFSLSHTWIFKLFPLTQCIIILRIIMPFNLHVNRILVSFHLLLFFYLNKIKRNTQSYSPSYISIVYQPLPIIHNSPNKTLPFNPNQPIYSKKWATLSVHLSQQKEAATVYQFSLPNTIFQQPDQTKMKKYSNPLSSPLNKFMIVNKIGIDPLPSKCLLNLLV